MKKVLVQYKVKAEKAKENRHYIEQIFAELKERQPRGSGMPVLCSRMAFHLFISLPLKHQTARTRFPF